MSKLLFISLGGSIEGVGLSIRVNKPDYIVFFCSKETYSQANEVIKLSKTEIKDYERIKTDDAQDLEKCYINIIKRLSQILDMWGILEKDIFVDFTGGTKTMSVAMVIATLRFGVQYCYIAGKKRNNGGIGIVEDGSYPVYTNPWNALALFERREIEVLFNNTNFEASQRKLNDLKQKVDEGNKKYYSVIEKLMEGYKEWDVFNHNSALINLSRAASDLKLINSVNGVESIRKLVDNLDENIKFLKKINECCGKKSKHCKSSQKCYLCMDLLANAKRRAEIEHKYDDAVARIYRAVEKLAQARLEKYDINTSDAHINKIPESIRDKYKKEYITKDKNQHSKVQFGLYAAYELLYELNDDLGIIYKKSEDELKKVMGSRNFSILAHGDSPIKESTYKELYDFALKFINITEDDLPVFSNLMLS